MGKYRKKPVVVEAVQFVIWDLNAELPLYFDAHGVRFPIYPTPYPHIVIPTLEGNMKAKNLDFIIKGIKGELYPCDMDIFEKTYDEVWETFND